MLAGIVGWRAPVRPVEVAAMRSCLCHRRTGRPAAHSRMRAELISAGTPMAEIDAMDLGQLALAWWQMARQRERIARWIR